MARAVFFADRALRSAAVTWLRMSSRLCLNNGMTALLNSPRNFLPGATRQVSVACSCSVHVGRPLVQHSSSTRRPPHDGKAAEPHHENKNESTGKLIWEGYKRNFKGQIPPAKTRLRCKRGKKIVNNPCPICKNDIDISYQDSSLLQQFVSPFTGEILEPSKTGLCRLQQKKLVDAIETAREYGFIEFTIPREIPKEDFRIPPWNRIDVRD